MQKYGFSRFQDKTIVSNDRKIRSKKHFSQGNQWLVACGFSSLWALRGAAYGVSSGYWSFAQGKRKRLHARAIYTRASLFGACTTCTHIVTLAAQPPTLCPHHKVHKYAFLWSRPVRKSGHRMKKSGLHFFTGRLRVGESGHHGSAARRYA